jgi:hypothetical protein
MSSVGVIESDSDPPNICSTGRTITFGKIRLFAAAYNVQISQAE